MPSGDYLYQKEENFIWLLGTKLPISIQIEKLTSVNEYKSYVNNDKAKAQLEELLNKEIEKEITEGETVNSKSEITYTVKDNKIFATITCICTENIVITKSVVVN